MIDVINFNLRLINFVYIFATPGIYHTVYSHCIQIISPKACSNGATCTIQLLSNPLIHELMLELSTIAQKNCIIQVQSSKQAFMYTDSDNASTLLQTLPELSMWLTALHNLSFSSSILYFGSTHYSTPLLSHQPLDVQT